MEETKFPKEILITDILFTIPVQRAIKAELAKIRSDHQMSTAKVSRRLSFMRTGMFDAITTYDKLQKHELFDESKLSTAYVLCLKKQSNLPANIRSLITEIIHPIVLKGLETYAHNQPEEKPVKKKRNAKS